VSVDLRLTDAGDLWVSDKARDLGWIGGIDGIAQLCATKLRLLRGEWLTDTSAGLDWQRVIGPGVTNQAIELEIRRVLDSVPGVRTVVSVEVTRTGRAAAVAWEATADTGELIAGTAEVEI